MTDNLTPWFPSRIKPVRVGVYETDFVTNTYQNWNGKYWGAIGRTPFAASLPQWKNHPSQINKAPRWRGLKSPA